MHLCLNITIWDDGFGTNNSPLREVQAVKQDGNFSFECNVIETFLPLWLSFSGAFWSDAETECLSFPGLFGDNVCGMHLLATIDGDTAEPSHQNTHRPEEPLFLHEEVAVETFRATIKVADNEIPIASVRSEGNNAFLWQRFCDGFREVEPFEENLAT